MPITTTTIGSYPKPNYLRIPNFVPKHADPTRRYSEYLESQSEQDLELLDRATRDNVRHQVEAGIDIPTDGETPRSHYVHYHLRQLGGVDFVNLSERATRGGAWKAKFPTVVSDISVGAHFLVQDWKRAQAATDHPVKMTLPGPMTIIDSVVDKHYRDEPSLAIALADALNYEARALADAGCRHIQIDEPVFARKSQEALDWGGKMLERAFDGIGNEVTRTVHICCGYPSAVDLEDFPKAPRKAYFELAAMLDQSTIDCVSIEDAHRYNELRLLQEFKKTRVILGVVQIAATRIETVDEISERLRSALKYIDKERLLAGPDCGLAMLDRDIVFAKLSNMCAAAKSF